MAATNKLPRQDTNNLSFIEPCKNNEATSSGSSFMNIDNDEEFACNTPIGEKIDIIERKIGEGKLRLLDNDGNSLVPTGIVESDSEVEVVFNKTANLRISTGIDLLNGMTISFLSLKKFVVNITNSSTNKAFQVPVYPSRVQ
uniref:Uncharacterized protein n=1 Tax=Tanacetum cinerariifolium TaxID=118510 RepID=A0A699L546_TANCI|nr:hypothetical protein [Tanacetum cinerariifolium]